MKKLILLTAVILLWVVPAFAWENNQYNYNDDTCKYFPDYCRQKQQEQDYQNKWGLESSYGRRGDGTIRPYDMVPQYSPEYYRLKQRWLDYGY